MADVVVIGSINMDVVVQVNNLPKPGETIHGHSIQKFPGGKGANQATALARLGNSVSLVGMVGSDEDGNQLRECLIKNLVDTTCLSSTNTKHTGTAYIIVDQNGHNQIIVISGANSSVDTNFIDKSRQILLNSKLLLMQYEIPMATIAYILSFASDNHIPVVVNPSPYYPIDSELLRKVDYLVLNETELAALLNCEINGVESAKDAALMVIDKGIRHVVITLGSQGAVFCDEKGKVSHSPAYKVEPVDTTGSGDAFIGGFLSGVMKKYSYADSVKLGNAVGALTVTKLGAQSSLPYEYEVSKFIQG